ncbi:MAG: class I SAM-dependent methyltransferase [Deltaproteobacteria bacterium]|nr:class I SAM-dependent methyltransferase [Deltaproteobacteria bacterium]
MSSPLARRMQSNIETTPVPRCPVCGASGGRPHLRVREHEYDTTTDDWFTLKACGDCGAWFLDPRPSDAALGVIYPPNYYAHSNYPDGRRSLFARLSERLFRARMRPVEAVVPLGPPTRWLEIGCGEGGIFASLQRLYGVRQVMGVDLSAAAVEVCRRKGFAAHVGRFESFAPPGGERFDVVFGSHVIEHVASPRDYVEKCFALLDPGGVCVFITPNKAVWEARLFGRHWGGLHAPRHWTLLDPDSARRLGERAGFAHHATLFSANGVFWSWSLHSLLQERVGRRLADRLFPSDDRMTRPGLANIARVATFSLLDMACVRLLGRSANMMVVLRKPG